MRSMLYVLFRWLVVLTAVGSLFGCAVQSTSSVQLEPPKKADKQVKTKAKVKKKAQPVKKTAEKRPVPAQKKKVVEEPPALPVPAKPDAESEEASEGEMVLGRTMFHYDYYPDPEVYFDTIRHLYFYRDGGGWTMSVALPSTYRKNLGTSVRLKLKNSRPYEQHREHRQIYPPGTGGRGF